MAIMVGTGRGARAGVLVKNAAALERAEKIKTLIVDKTGTLTQGRPAFRDVIGQGNVTADEVLRLAASLDQGSEHPLADAIVAEARRRNLALSGAEEFESVTGLGVRAFSTSEFPAHAAAVGQELTADEYYLLVLMADLGGQFYSRENAPGADY